MIKDLPGLELTVDEAKGGLVWHYRIFQKSPEPTTPGTGGYKRGGWKKDGEDPQRHRSLASCPHSVSWETAFTPSNQSLEISSSEEYKIEVCGLGTWKHHVQAKIK